MIYSDGPESFQVTNSEDGQESFRSLIVRRLSYVFNEKRKKTFGDFPGGPQVKTSPSNAGDAGLIPG